jgi:hypothetical protein
LLAASKTPQELLYAFLRLGILNQLQPNDPSWKQEVAATEGTKANVVPSKTYIRK